MRVARLRLFYLWLQDSGPIFQAVEALVYLVEAPYHIGAQIVDSLAQIGA